ncbi:MAG: hypothetical protein ISEC1_P0429 [Thiomicrorhabdus sp.]|nr:MAG: hypothetical protein ISEC1_P0429 [Thiomicrorhabdus sp.]
MKQSTALIPTLLLSITIASLTGCLSKSTKTGSVGIEREQLLLISSEEINNGGKQAYANILEESKKKKVLNKNSEMLQRVRKISKRIIPQTHVFRKDAPSWAWEVNVIESDELNAWCMPGGKIAFYSGIINKLKLTDAEIAAIMGHEIAHALREHGRERASQQTITQLGLSVVSMVTGMSSIAMDMTSLAANVTLTLPNSRTHEIEADRMGVELAARAGYNPYAAVSVWRKMANESKGGNPPELLSTHPSHDHRISDLNKYAKRVEPLFKAANKH